MTDLIAAEWLKLRTTRLLQVVVPAVVAISTAAVAGGVFSEHRAGVALESSDGIRRVLSVTSAGAIVVLVAGIVISAGEHRHGTVADTFLTTPRRRPVVMAKLAIGAALGLAAGVIISVTSLVAAGVFYTVKESSFPLGDAEVWKTLAGTLTYTTLFTVVGVGLGAAIRNQVAAVAGALAWLAVVEHTLVNLAPDVARWLPAAAGQAIVRTPLDGLLSPLAGVAVLAAYAAGFALAGIRVETTRDA